MTASPHSTSTQFAPKVSVCMITYRHEQYIGQAIESVMAQETDFAVELVIGEDCSPDNTRAVIQQYQKRFLGRIRLITTEQNVGMMPNFIRTYQACTGQYVAMLEGDDYWTDPHKLRDQVAILDQNSDVVFCFAACAEVDEQGQILKENFVPSAYRRDLTQLEIVGSYCPPTLSVLFRNYVLTNLPPSFAVVGNGDYFLFGMLTDFGHAAYLPRNVAHYRRHGGGVWSSQSQEKQYQSNLNTKLAMLGYFAGRYQATIMHDVNWYYVQLLTLLWHQGRRAEFWPLYRDFVRVSFQTLNKELPAFTLRLLTGRLSTSALAIAPTGSY